MNTLMQPLREEHRELLPHIEKLRTLAESAGEMPVERFRDELGATYTFLVDHLMVHARAEERVLYPAVARALGATEATATMSRDHKEVAALTGELGELRGRPRGPHVTEVEVKEARRLLYGLYAILKLHFAKEEEVYLPILEARLTPDEARTLFVEMERAAQEGRAQPGAAAHGTEEHAHPAP